MKKLKKLYFISIVLLLCCSSLWAQRPLSSIADLTWDRARILPAGQSLLQLQTSYQKTQNIYDENGAQRSFGESYNSRFSWNRALDVETNKKRKRQIRRILKNSNISRKSSIATIQFDVEREEYNFATQWSYGLTQNWMVGVSVPIIYSKTKIESRLATSKSFSQLRRKMQKSNNQEADDQLKKFRNHVQKTYTKSVSNRGTVGVNGEIEQQHIGDVEMMSQHLIGQGRKLIWSLQERVTLPTATSGSPFQYIDEARGDGQLDLSIYNLIDYQFNKRLLVRTKFGHRMQFADEVVVRVPSSNGNRIESKIDYSVKRDLGDISNFDVNLDFRLFSNWTISAGYSILVKSKDKFSGQEYEESSYQYLSDDSGSELQTTRLGLNYLPQSFSNRSEVSHKYVVGLNSYQVIDGRNTTSDPYTSLDILYYF